jgi:hypothetical protein
MESKTPIRQTTNYPLTKPSRLGREIKISPKAHIDVIEAGYKTEFGVPIIEVLIGIGKDHTASLIMDTEAWEALRAGEKINITTTEEYKKQYEYKIRKK